MLKIKKEHAPLLYAMRSSWKELTKIMLVVALRSLSYFCMVSYLSLYLKHRGVLVFQARILAIYKSA